MSFGFWVLGWRKISINLNVAGVHYLPMEDEAIFPYVSSVVHSILLKDVVSRHQIRNVQQLERIVNFVFQHSGNITTGKSISDYFKSQELQASVDTVINYLNFIKESFLVYQASRYDIKGKRILELFEKYYPSDTELRHGILGYRESDISGLLENIADFLLQD